MWICFLIVASGIVCVIETVPGWRESEDLWFAFEVFFVAGFTIEFAMRWVLPCPTLTRHSLVPLTRHALLQGSCPNAWDFWTTPMNWIDLSESCAVCPRWLHSH